MFVRLKENIPCHSASEPMKFSFGRAGFIELAPGELTQHSKEIMEFFAEFHFNRVDFVDASGEVVNILNENGEIDFSKLEGSEPEPKEIDFGGEKVKSKKLKTSATNVELRELIYGPKDGEPSPE